MRLHQFIGAAFVLAGLVSWAGNHAKAPVFLVEAIDAAIFGAYPIVVEYLEYRRKTVAERIRELTTGGIYRNPFLTSFFVVCALQVVMKASGAVFHVAAWFAFDGFPGLDPLERQKSLVVGTSVTTILITAFVMVPIAKYATHRIQKFPLVWILGALAVNSLISWAVVVIFFDSARPQQILEVPISTGTGLLREVMAEAVSFLPGALIGYLWAKRTQVVYTMSRLFGGLSRPDQIALIDLIGQQPQEHATVMPPAH